MFKPKDNEEDLNRNNARKKDKGPKDSNVEIRIEGKDKDGAACKSGNNDPNKSQVDDSYDKKAMANIDVRDIERIVFNINPAEKVYGDVSGNTMGKKASISMPEYVEEESYVNPPQIDS